MAPSQAVFLSVFEAESSLIDSISPIRVLAQALREVDLKRPEFPPEGRGLCRSQIRFHEEIKA